MPNNETIGGNYNVKGVVDCDCTFLTIVSVYCCWSINNKCKVAALKVQCKRRYSSLGLQQDTSRVHDISGPVDPPQ